MYLILSYLMLFYVILRYLMLSYVILRYLMLSYVILCYLMLSYVILCYLMVSYGILWYLMVSYVILLFIQTGCQLSNTVIIVTRSRQWTILHCRIRNTYRTWIKDGGKSPIISHPSTTNTGPEISNKKPWHWGSSLEKSLAQWAKIRPCFVPMAISWSK